jgi:prolyl-tRNA synthetase
MLQSKLFCKTKKEKPKGAETISHQYLVRGDFIEQTIAGVYRLLPLGWLVYQKIENIIREEMLNLGAQEVYLPVFQNKNLWLETNRWETIDPPLFKLKDRHQKEIALGPTHEEEMVDIVRKRVKSYKDLPLALFQIQTKFRNEIRPTGGLLRTREFIMKDLYSFDKSKDEALKFYSKVKKAYFRIFRRCELNPICVEASTGTIGGEYSEEFMVLAESGEDRVLICENCDFSANIEKIGEKKECPKCQKLLKEKRAIEIGHIFYLGTKYSQLMNATFLDKNGEKKFIYMGCYGIGLQRLMATIVEVWHDEKGIIWPKSVAPFLFHLIPIETSGKVKKIAKTLEVNLQKRNIEVLLDDRENVTTGEKFADCDLIGIPVRIVISEKTLKKNSVEIKKRKEKKVKIVKINEFLKNPQKYA